MSTIILYTIKCLEVIKLPFILVLHPAHRARMKTLYYTAKPCFLFICTDQASCNHLSCVKPLFLSHLMERNGSTELRSELVTCKQYVVSSALDPD